MPKFVKSIKVDIYKSFWVTAVGAIALGYTTQFVVLVAVVLIHELAHMVVSGLYGAKASRVAVMPVGLSAVLPGFDLLSTGQKTAITLAGPLVNFTTWLVLAVFFSGQFDFLRQTSLIICLFNMLPIYPLDGGRLFITLINNRIGLLPAVSLLRRMSVVGGVFFVLAGIVQVVLFPYNVSLICIGCYVLALNKKDSAFMQLQFIRVVLIDKQNIRKRHLPVKHYAVFSDMKLKDAVALMSLNRYCVYNIISDGQVVGILTEQTLTTHILANGLGGTLSQLNLFQNAG